MGKPISAETRKLLEQMDVDAAQEAGPDRLQHCKTKVRELRDHVAELEDLEAKVKEKKATILEIRRKELVDLLDKAGIPSLTLAAEGNSPEFTVSTKTIYHANIPEENKDAAYRWLKEHDQDYMIKTIFSISFGLDEAKECAAFEKKLAKITGDYERKQAVPWNTLTAWVKEEFEAGRKLSAKVMGLLGAEHYREAIIETQTKKRK